MHLKNVLMDHQQPQVVLWKATHALTMVSVEHYAERIGTMNINTLVCRVDEIDNCDNEHFGYALKHAAEGNLYVAFEEYLKGVAFEQLLKEALSWINHPEYVYLEEINVYDGYAIVKAEYREKYYTTQIIWGEITSDMSFEDRFLRIKNGNYFLAQALREAEQGNLDAAFEAYVKGVGLNQVTRRLYSWINDSETITFKSYRKYRGYAVLEFMYGSLVYTTWVSWGGNLSDDWISVIVRKNEAFEKALEKKRK